jgi:hypothetical protein
MVLPEEEVPPEDEEALAPIVTVPLEEEEVPTAPLSQSHWNKGDALSRSIANLYRF